MCKLKLAVHAMFSQRKDDDCCRRAILDIQTSDSGLFRSDRDLRRVRSGAEPDPLPESGRPHRNDAGGLRRLTSVLRASSGGLWSTPITRMRRPAVGVCRFLLHRHVQRSGLEARDREACFCTALSHQETVTSGFPIGAPGRGNYFRANGDRQPNNALSQNC